jgi:uncharacterized protein YndB with AHSA1/START domain
MRFTEQITIKAPVGKVFEYVSDMSKLTEWGSFSHEVQQTSSGPVGVGSTFDTSGKQFGKHTDKCTVTEYEPGKKFVIEAKGDAGHVRNWFELEDVGGSTRLTKGQEFITRALSTKIFSPVVRKVAPKGLMKDLERIKAKIEGA